MPRDNPSAEHDPGFDGGVSRERVAGLFDGIVAITATLLIIDLGVDAGGGPLTPAALAAALPGLVHWIVSFIMVAVIWKEFHLVFAHSKHWDGGLLTVTFAQMAAISLIPFAAEVVGDYPDSELAALVFAAVMGLNGLLVAANVFILGRKAHLHAPSQSRDQLARRMRGQLMVYPAGIAISVADAWLHDPLLGILAWALCPLVVAVHVRRAHGAPARLPLQKDLAA